MPPQGRLLRDLQALEAAGSMERQLARRRRQQQRQGDILTTVLAYPLDLAVQRMGLGIAIGDPLRLVHEPANPQDPHAVQVLWNDRWIGYVPRAIASLLVEEVPAIAEGMEAVVTGLATTTTRDAFRLEFSIPIPAASQRLLRRGAHSTFAWDLEPPGADGRVRLMIQATEAAFRQLQELLAAHYAVLRSGYSYYPAAEGRRFPWYLSLMAADGGTAIDPLALEGHVRGWFGVPSETTLRRERRATLRRLEERQVEIAERLAASRVAEARLRRRLEATRSALERRASQAVAQSEEALELAGSLETGLRQELRFRDEALQLALAELASLQLVADEREAERAVLLAELGYFRSRGAARLEEDPGPLSDAAAGEDLQQRLLGALQDLAAMRRPHTCLQLVQRIWPDSLELLPSALAAAERVHGFEHGDRLFDLLRRLATSYRQARLEGAPDVIAQKIFGASYAPRESESVERNERARRARTFLVQGQPVAMWQHLRIGVKESPHRTLRLHFCWDPNRGLVVIGHCGAHLFSP